MDQQSLQDYFEFDAFDLEANRFGRLSENQQKKIVKDKKDNQKFQIQLGSFFLSLAALLLLISIIFFKALGFSLIATGVSILLFGGLGAILFSGNFTDPNNILSKIKVKKVEGPVNIVAVVSTGTGNHHYTDYELHINKKEFDVDEDAADIMMQGEIYAVYYYEDDKDAIDPNPILSVEWVSKG